jgi:hypothetical protein
MVAACKGNYLIIKSLCHHIRKVVMALWNNFFVQLVLKACSMQRYGHDVEPYTKELVSLVIVNTA